MYSYVTVIDATNSSYFFDVMISILYYLQSFHDQPTCSYLSLNLKCCKLSQLGLHQMHSQRYLTTAVPIFCIGQDMQDDPSR